MIRPIETTYKGYRFRSRLEAKWAVFFDVLGIKWLYEIEGFQTAAGWYLPDFYLPKLDCFAEVKPDGLSRAEFLKCSQLPKSCLLLDSMPDADRLWFCCHGLNQPELETYEYHESGKNCGRVHLHLSVDRLYWSFGEEVDCNVELYVAAVNAARSARFEFGESGPSAE